MTAAQKAQDVAPVKVGDVDPMSQGAAMVGASLCGAYSFDRKTAGASCTRAAGHDEAKPTHPGSLHVVAGDRDGFRVRAVWS